MDMTREQILQSIVPKSDQWNFEDFIGGPKTFVVAGVSAGSAEQPVNIRLEGEKRFYRPSKTMRRVLVLLWGDDGHKWVGRSMTLYGDPGVMFGGVKVGGIKISHMSDIDGPQSINLTVKRGQKAPIKVLPIPRGNGGSAQGVGARQEPLNSGPANEAAAEPPALDEDSDLYNGLRGAAEMGTVSLQNAWAALLPEERKSLGKDLLAVLKSIATDADLSDTRRDVGGNEMTTLDAG